MTHHDAQTRQPVPDRSGAANVTHDSSRKVGDSTPRSLTPGGSLFFCRKKACGHLLSTTLEIQIGLCTPCQEDYCWNWSARDRLADAANGRK
jgi:hypothetical protein